MEALRACMAAQLVAEPYAYLTVGRRVRIKYGPLAELGGVLGRWKNTLRVVLSLDLIARSAAVAVDAADIQSAPQIVCGGGSVCACTLSCLAPKRPRNKPLK